MAFTDEHLKGKICLVTGATSGMGEATAQALAQMGTTVIAVGRDPQRGAAALDRIKKAAPNARIEFMLADLSSQVQVRQLAQDFQRKYTRLDVLVNNAGALFSRRQESVDGIEMTFALNHLGYFLLTNLLLDTLKASAPARIINISSFGHRKTQVNFEDLQAKKSYAGLLVYRQSKLANLLFTYELARRLEGSRVTVNAVNPGLVATRFSMNNFGFIGDGLTNLFVRLYSLITLDADQGAQTAIYLATSPAMAGVTGKYFQKKKETQSSPDSHDRAAATRLWQLSEVMTGISG